MQPDILFDLFGISDCEFVRTEDVVKGKDVIKVIHLRYKGEYLDTCPVCGNKLYGHGDRKLEIIDTPLLGHKAILSFEFSRKRCPACHFIWQPSFENIDEKRKMTKRCIQDIAQKSLRNTFEDVCNDFDITANTAKNVFVDYLNEMNDKLKFVTPAFIGIDEIKIKKLGEITVITDLEHKTLYDMLKGRNQASLTEYCKKMPNRENVLWICSDMYRPFQGTIGDAFPNATWVIDHFHVVMKANEAVDSVRRTLQDSMTKKERIQTKRGLAYTLKTRAKDLDPEEAEKINLIRNSEKHYPMAKAFDLKEDFFNIYDNNPTSKINAQNDFENWEKSIPEDAIYEKFRELANTVHNFYDQIFAYWDCPIAITNGYTECSNRLIRENNLRGRGYSFEVLRARTLYRKTNLTNIIENGLATIGPEIKDEEPVFRFDSSSESEISYDEETGEIK